MTDARTVATNTQRLWRAAHSTPPRTDRMACSSHGLALGLIKAVCLPRDPASGRRAGSHGRIGVAAAERGQAVGGPGDVEVEREVLADGEHVAQVPLQRVARVEALRSIARPQGLHRLARLVDGEG